MRSGTQRVQAVQRVVSPVSTNTAADAADAAAASSSSDSSSQLVELLSLRVPAISKTAVSDAADFLPGRLLQSLSYTDTHTVR